MDVRGWISEARGLLAQLSRIDLGFPQGDNMVRPAPGAEALDLLIDQAGFDRSSSLVAFLRECDGLSLSDVHVGYFIHSVEQILQGFRSGEPRQVSGVDPLTILVFGSDGGGGRFALQAVEGDAVLYLPVGAVRDRVFDGSRTAIRTLAPDFPSFLRLLLADLRAFVEDKPGWRYMV
jgi:hypothetical protein